MWWAIGEPLLAGRQTETEGDMGPARDRRIAERSTDAEARRSTPEPISRSGERLEVEAEAFDGGEPGLSAPPLDHAALTADQFQLGRRTQIPTCRRHDTRSRAHWRKQLVVFTQERRQFQCLEVMAPATLVGVSVMTRLANHAHIDLAAARSATMIAPAWPRGCGIDIQAANHGPIIAVAKFATAAIGG